MFLNTNRLIGFGLIALLLVSLIGCSNFDHKDQDKTLILFDGSSLDFWEATEGSIWEIDGVELKPDINAKTGMLYTREKYSNYRLNLEFMPDAEVNSGIFVQCPDFTDINANTCYEANIWDQHPNQQFRTGAVVARFFPPLAQVQTIGKWNRYEIAVEGPLLKAWVNGVLTAELKDGDLSEGHIALQWFGPGPIRFRNIRLQLND